jgi:hypothetical protein
MRLRPISDSGPVRPFLGRTFYWCCRAAACQALAFPGLGEANVVASSSRQVRRRDQGESPGRDARTGMNCWSSRQRCTWYRGRSQHLSASINGKLQSEDIHVFYRSQTKRMLIQRRDIRVQGLHLVLQWNCRRPHAIESLVVVPARLCAPYGEHLAALCLKADLPCGFLPEILWSGWTAGMGTL